MFENYTTYQSASFVAADWTISTYLAEEGGGGKALLLEKGAYEGIDVCVMYICVYIDLLTSFTLNVHQQDSPHLRTSLLSPNHLITRPTISRRRIPRKAVNRIFYRILEFSLTIY